MKRKVWNRKLCIGIICLAMWWIFLLNGKGSEADYIITPITANNDYYDLTVEPSRKQTIEAEVRNNTDDDVTINAGFYTAVMGQDDTIQYTTALSEYFSGSREIVIPANKTYLFQFTVEMPSGGLKTPIVGGIVLQIDADQSTAWEQQEDLEFLAMDSDLAEQAEIIRKGLGDWIQQTETTAAYSYVVPLFLKTGESSSAPDLVLKNILTDDYENNINVTIQNGTTLSANEVNIEAIIRKKGKKEVFYEAIEENVEIPANINYELSIPSLGKEIKAGEYTVQIELAIGDTKWQWIKDFVISDEAEGIEVAASEEPVITSYWGHVIITLAGLLLVTVIVSIILYRKKQREDEARIKIIKEIIKAL